MEGSVELDLLTPMLLADGISEKPGAIYNSQTVEFCGQSLQSVTQSYKGQRILELASRWAYWPRFHVLWSNF